MAYKFASASSAVGYYNRPDALLDSITFPVDIILKKTGFTLSVSAGDPLNAADIPSADDYDLYLKWPTLVTGVPAGCTATYAWQRYYTTISEDNALADGVDTVWQWRDSATLNNCTVTGMLRTVSGADYGDLVSKSAGVAAGDMTVYYVSSVSGTTYVSNKLMSATDGTFTLAHNWRWIVIGGTPYNVGVWQDQLQFGTGNNFDYKRVLGMTGDHFHADSIRLGNFGHSAGWLAKSGTAAVTVDGLLVSVLITSGALQARLTRYEAAYTWIAVDFAAVAPAAGGYVPVKSHSLFLDNRTGLLSALPDVAVSWVKEWAVTLADIAWYAVGQPGGIPVVLTDYVATAPAFVTLPRTLTSLAYLYRNGMGVESGGLPVGNADWLYLYDLMAYNADLPDFESDFAINVFAAPRPSAAVDRNNIAWVSYVSGQQPKVTKRAARGETWDAAVNVGAGAKTDAHVSLGEDGLLHVASTDGAAVTAYDSDDDGATWGAV